MDPEGRGGSEPGNGSPPSTKATPDRWRRVPGWVHRAVDEEILLAAPGRDPRSIGGIATAVWLVLERPATSSQVEDLISRRWPGRPVYPAMVLETIELLHHAELIEAL